MKFNEKLQSLRKEHGFSQEQLADKLQVSRQAVSKWESGISYPETEKLIEISHLFCVSIDSLLKEEKVEKIEKTLTTSQIEDCTKFYKKFAKMITLGVALCIVALFTTYLVDYVFHNDGFNVAIFFGIIIFPVAIFVYYGLAYSRYEEYKEMYMKRYIDQEEKRRFYNRFAFSIMLGVCFCIMAIISAGIIESYQKESPWTVVAFFGFVMVGVSFLVYYGMEFSRYVTDKDNKQKEKSHLADKICGVVMLIATIIFLLLGFLENAWHPSWIVFPIGGIICGIVSTILED